jgi:hypothetical protein
MSEVLVEALARWHEDLQKKNKTNVIFAKVK